MVDSIANHKYIVIYLTVNIIDTIIIIIIINVITIVVVITVIINILNINVAREQRVTGTLVFIMVGLSAFMARVLQVSVILYIIYLLH